MKIFFAALLLLSSCLICRSQGTVYFSNLYGQQVNAPVFAADGTGALAGPQFMAGLLAGPSSDSLSLIGTTPFLQGTAAGYFYGGTPAIGTVSPHNTRVDTGRCVEHGLGLVLRSGPDFWPAEFVVAILGIYREYWWRTSKPIPTCASYRPWHLTGFPEWCNRP